MVSDAVSDRKNILSTPLPVPHISAEATHGKVSLAMAEQESRKL